MPFSDRSKILLLIEMPMDAESNEGTDVPSCSSDARLFVIFWNPVLKTGFPEFEFECLPPERSLWLPPTEVSLLPCAFPLGLLGLFPVLLASLFPEEELFGASGV